MAGDRIKRKSKHDRVDRMYQNTQPLLHVLLTSVLLCAVHGGWVGGSVGFMCGGVDVFWYTRAGHVVCVHCTVPCSKALRRVSYSPVAVCAYCDTTVHGECVCGWMGGWVGAWSSHGWMGVSCLVYRSRSRFVVSAGAAAYLYVVTW